MFKSRAVLPLAIGLGVGLLAVKMGVDAVRKAQARGDLQRVVVAAQELALGAELSEDMMRIADVPSSLVPAGTFTSVGEVVGRVNTRTIIPGMPICESILAPPGTPPGLSWKIPDGMRAVSVEVDEFTSVAGFIHPGSRVDVVALLKCTRNGRKDNISRTVLQDIEVAAVGQEMTDAGGSGANVTRSVTLVVRPADAPLLHLAAEKGKIRLAMRNARDTMAAKVGFASESGLVSGIEDEQPDSGQHDAQRVSWLGQVASGLLQSGLRGAPDREPHVAVAVARPETWSVTLQVGQKTEVLHFASAQSWRQVTPQDLARTAHKVDEPSTEGRYEWVGDGADNAGTAPDRPSD